MLLLFSSLSYLVLVVFALPSRFMLAASFIACIHLTAVFIALISGAGAILIALTYGAGAMLNAHLSCHCSSSCYCRATAIAVALAILLTEMFSCCC